MTDSLRWNLPMTKLLQLLIPRLSDTVAAWDAFQRREIGYFVDDNERSTASALGGSVDAVDKVFLELGVRLLKLQDLKRELEEDNPHGVSYSISLRLNLKATHLFCCKI